MEANVGPNRSRIAAATAVVTGLLLASTLGLSRLAHADAERATATAIAMRTAVAESTHAARLAEGTAAAVSARSTVSARQTETAVQVTEAALTPVAAIPDPTFAAQVNLRRLLPEPREPSPHLSVVSTERWSVDEVANSYRDPEEAAERMRNLGWDENIMREYSPESDAQLPDDATNYLQIYIDRFVTRSGALAAMRYAVDQGTLMPSEAASIPPIGDESRAVTGIEGDGDRFAIIYAQWGKLFIFIYSSSPAGDPLPDAIAAALSVVDQNVSSVPA